MPPVLRIEGINSRGRIALQHNNEANLVERLSGVPSRKRIRHDGTMTTPSTPVFRWIKTECGRARFTELAARSGPLARLRLGWFVLIGALRDWRLPDPDHRPMDQEPDPGS